MPRPQRAPSILFAALLGCASTAPATDSFERVMDREVDGVRYRYQLEVPSSAERPDPGWPLLIFLHGSGERGSDLALVATHGPPKLVGEVPELESCVLAAPQCPEDQWWRVSTLSALVEELAARPDVDPDRIYLTGLSMGGYGTWDLLAALPDRFAAAIPICGGGETARVWPEQANGFELDELLKAKHVPLRVFHGSDDPVIPVEESRLLVEALQAAGADVELTVYPGVGHDSWTRTYADPELFTWLFAQSR